MAGNNAVFPYTVKWLGGRDSIHEKNFASRNAQICFRDMKERDKIVDVTLKIIFGRLQFILENVLHKEYSLSSMKRFHKFSTDPAYLVLEICEADKASHLEVLLCQNDEIVHKLEDFISNVNLSGAPPTAEKTFSITGADSISSNEISPPDDNEDRSEFEILDNLQMNILEAGYSPSPQPSRSEQDAVLDQTTGDEEDGVDGEDEMANYPVNGQIKIISEPSAYTEINITNELEIKDSPPERKECNETKKVPKIFAKIQCISDIIDETTFLHQNYNDDGKMSIIMKKKARKQKPRHT